MRVKSVIVKAHMVLGLLSGIIVFVMGITGALYAFKSEIESLTAGYRKVAVEQKQMILPSEAIEIGEALNPEIALHGVVYQEAEDALQIIYYQPEPLYYGAAYLNPYSGKVIKNVNFVNTFFGFVLRGHIALWLPLKIGMPVVAIAAVVFLILLISGLIIWWPRRNSSTGSFSFAKGAAPSVRRLELHKIVGFYASWLAILIVLTGMTWVFHGFDRTVYKAMGGEKEVRYSVPPSDTTKAGSVAFDGAPIDVLYKQIKRQNPEMKFIELHAVDDANASILVELNRDPSTNWKMDYLFFDQYTLAPIEPSHVYGRFEEAGVPERIKRMYYDIHTGSIGGFPGKVIAFLVSLFCASLPVTGFMLWWNRYRQKMAIKQKMAL